jgi:hypothetical protein
MSLWQSAQFHCLDDRNSAATLQCVACGHKFEADVEYAETQDCWVLAKFFGSTWTGMYVKCPHCGCHEQLPDYDVVELRYCGEDSHGLSCNCSTCIVERDYEKKKAKARVAQAERAEFYAMLAAERRASGRCQDRKYLIQKKRPVI